MTTLSTQCTFTMQRNVRTRKFTVNVRKNPVQNRRVQLIATNPYCSMLLLNVPQRRPRDKHNRLRRPLGTANPKRVRLGPFRSPTILELSLSGDPQISL